MKKVKKLFCDSCGDSLNYIDKDHPEGISIVGLSLTFSSDDNSMKNEAEKRFSPYILGKTYNFCFKCWLKSLGAKP